MSEKIRLRVFITTGRNGTHNIRAIVGNDATAPFACDRKYLEATFRPESIETLDKHGSALAWVTLEEIPA